MVKLKHYVSKATLISVYYSLIYPYLTYACTLWGNNYNAPLSHIVKLQNKAVRVINDVTPMESITPHYTSLGLLKFPDNVKLNTCMLFYVIISISKTSARGSSGFQMLETFKTTRPQAEFFYCFRAFRNLMKPEARVF